MKLGEVRQFRYTAEDGITSALGTVISTNRVTMDGHKVVDVRFNDGTTRKYSLVHLKAIAN
ncbi:hypothetical protein J41TS12_10820 [Paenibacillus antibioticophila]|uniref:Uncharacterized protein n=1 Tax=Paenibacillus antibioticophila TaxID=1274374 RepID=A0A920CDT7_9BACL|nr:hypothetical protein J41TS12_10820 [Paenibacillus antibioticophila]